MSYRQAMTGQKRPSTTTGDGSAASEGGAESAARGGNPSSGGGGLIPSGSSGTSGSSHDFFGSVSSFQLTGQKLNGQNFLEWAQSVKLAIDGRGKLGYLTGERERPATGDPGLATWKSENSLVIAWLMNSMEPSIAKPHMFLPTAKDVWEAVREMYSDIENSSQIFELKTRLWSSKQGSRDVTNYYNDIVSLWQELDLCYDDDWECSADSVKHKKREENEHVYSFLAGLNQELDEVRGRILGRKPLPSLREVFSEVRREEARRKVMIGKTAHESEGSALVSRSSDGEGRSSKKPWCDYCKKPWHTRETCWKIHGKPANWKKKQPGDNWNSQANVTDSGKESSSGVQPFTKEQLEQICKILQSQNLVNPNPSGYVAKKGFDFGEDDWQC